MPENPHADYINQLLTNIIKSDLDDSLLEKLTPYFRREEWKRKSLIFSSGDANTRHYFIEKGLLRLYVIDPNGKEFNVLFARENQVIGDLATPKVTPYFLDTIEDSIVWSISEGQLTSLMKVYGKPEGMGSINYMRRAYVFLQKRLVYILTQSAEENYAQLLEQYPKLVHRLPQYHIASYLGVSPEFLSKIIKKHAKGQNP